jgi:hypothetical protein
MLDFVEAMVVRTDGRHQIVQRPQKQDPTAPFGSTTHYLLPQALADEGSPRHHEDPTCALTILRWHGRAAILMRSGSGSRTDKTGQRWHIFMTSGIGGKAWLSGMCYR